MKLIHILSSASLIGALQMSAQWQTGGNNAATINPALGKNFIGSDGTNNTWIKMGVQGSQDIFIDNNPAQLLPPSSNNPSALQGGHWVGLGRVFKPTTGPGSNVVSAPRAHLHIHGGGYSAFPGTGGFSGGLRNWFNTGTLYTENSNSMYVGLKTEDTS